VAPGDIDGDGLSDAAVTSWDSNEALILFGGRSGIRQGFVEGGQNPWGVALADLDGDGGAEILVLDNTGGMLRIYSNGPDD
jgi:hypothetical protein